MSYARQGKTGMKKISLLKQCTVVFKRAFLDLFALLKVALNSSLFGLDPRSLKIPPHDACIVVGNGPSLKETLEKHAGSFKGKSFVCMNEFATSEYFDALRPGLYLFVDPAYWDPAASEHIRALVENSVRVFKEQVTWPMTIVMPFEARKWSWFKDVPSLNKNISLAYINVTSVDRRCSPVLKNFLYRLNWATPHPQTVLISAIFLSINMGYGKIFLVGADHSWHENLVVGEDNVVYTRLDHFFDKQKVSLRPFFSPAPYFER